MKLIAGERPFSVNELSVSSNGSKWVKLVLCAWQSLATLRALSVSSNGSKWVKLMLYDKPHTTVSLSVSSNGSKWVKPCYNISKYKRRQTFSILERIEVGETQATRGTISRITGSFSILERIEVGETLCRGYGCRGWIRTFSILERIEVGETSPSHLADEKSHAFSILERIEVGETLLLVVAQILLMCFQYPRTDRSG